MWKGKISVDTKKVNFLKSCYRTYCLDFSNGQSINILTRQFDKSHQSGL